MIKEVKKVAINFVKGNPMDLAKVSGAEVSGAEEMGAFTEEQKELIDTVGPTVVAYMAAAKELLSGKLAHLKGLAPPHLADSGNVLVVGCLDGVVIRYETKSDGPSNVIWGCTEESLTEITSALSEGLIRIRHDQTDTLDAEAGGIELKMVKTDAMTGESTEIFTIGIIFDVILITPPVAPSPASKPFCLLSLRNSLEFGLRGRILPANTNREHSQEFLATSLLRLPVGWACIEVFPSTTARNWQPDFAPAWVENDLLGAAISHQFREAQLNSLDPNVAARRHFSSLFEEYKKLLDSNPQREEILQEFLAANPILLCPAHIRMWPKLALGAHVTDFVFQEGTGDYVLVELEKSTHPLFIKNGHLSSQLNHARGQIQDWRRYLEDNLSTVQRELGLHGISPSPPCLIVIGRADSLSEENRRKLAAIENEAPRLKILTYDHVLENAKAVIENLLGPLWNVQGNTRIYYPRTGSLTSEV